MMLRSVQSPCSLKEHIRRSLLSPQEVHLQLVICVAKEKLDGLVTVVESSILSEAWQRLEHIVAVDDESLVEVRTVHWDGKCGS